MPKSSVLTAQPRQNVSRTPAKSILAQQAKPALLITAKGAAGHASAPKAYLLSHVSPIPAKSIHVHMVKNAFKATVVNAVGSAGVWMALSQDNAQPIPAKSSLQPVLQVPDVWQTTVEDAILLVNAQMDPHQQNVWLILANQTHAPGDCSVWRTTVGDAEGYVSPVSTTGSHATGRRDAGVKQLMVSTSVKASVCLCVYAFMPQCG